MNEGPGNKGRRAISKEWMASCRTRLWSKGESKEKQTEARGK